MNTIRNQKGDITTDPIDIKLMKEYQKQPYTNKFAKSVYLHNGILLSKLIRRMTGIDPIAISFGWGRQARNLM